MGGRPCTAPGATKLRPGLITLALARTLQLPEPLTRTEDLLVYQVLLRDRVALTDLIHTDG